MWSQRYEFLDMLMCASSIDLTSERRGSRRSFIPYCVIRLGVTTYWKADEENQ